MHEMARRMMRKFVEHGKVGRLPPEMVEEMRARLDYSNWPVGPTLTNNHSPQSQGSSTYLNHLEPSPGGRFAALREREERIERTSRPQIIGQEPSANYPAAADWSRGDVGVEPLIDATFCGYTFGEAMGEPHEQPLLAPDDLASADPPLVIDLRVGPLSAKERNDWWLSARG
jgi:hypothetical protein